MAEDYLAVIVLQVLIQPQAKAGLGQDGGERGLRTSSSSRRRSRLSAR
jgi:hypothetical protein